LSRKSGAAAFAFITDRTSTQAESRPDFAEWLTQRRVTNQFASAGVSNSTFFEKMQAPPPKSDTTDQDQLDRNLIQEFFGRMALEDRWQPVAEEMQWVISGCKNPTEHKKILPDYCYPILDSYRRTVFKNLPSIEDTIFIIKNADGSIKKHKIDWRCMGRLMSIGERGVRYFDLEAMPLLKADGLLDLKPEKEEMVLRMLFGNRRLKQKLVKLILRPHRFLKKFVDKCRSIYFRMKILGFSEMGRLAYRTGPEAVAEFKAGLAEGQVGFLNNDGQLVGESNRTSNYQFMLLAWPEIKEMLARKPVPTRTDVFEWTKPYTKAGLCSFIDIDQFRDFCEDIKLKFAGRTPKKA
jgi:hypothetical protein